MPAKEKKKSMLDLWRARIQKPSSLKWKIFLSLLIFCALLLVILWVLQTAFLAPMYESIRKAEIERAIALVGENLDQANLHLIIKDLQDNQEIMVTALPDFRPPDRPVPRDKMPDRQVITEVREFTKANGETITLVFYAIISPVNATISTLQVQLYYVTGIMIVLSIILALIIARLVARPIESLNRHAKEIRQANYEVHFEGDSYLEIYELANTLNQAVKELAQVDHLRKELIANISHDLRTPLALIYSHAEMMHDFPQEITSDQTQVIMDETGRLANLVSDLLDISRIESGKLDLVMSEFDLTAMLNKTIENLGRLLSRDGYSFDFQANESVIVRGDETRINQVIYNLLANAVHYSDENRNIRIKQEVEDGTARIEIIDRGKGIAPEQIANIWDRYYKSGDTHKRALMGTGLGLSIVKEIMDHHHGKYGVESVLGMGSVFWIQLDLVDQDRLVNKL